MTALLLLSVRNKFHISFESGILYLLIDSPSSSHLNSGDGDSALASSIGVDLSGNWEWCLCDHLTDIWLNVFRAERGDCCSWKAFILLDYFHFHDSHGNI